MARNYKPPTDVLRFSAEYEVELNAAIASRMRKIGVPEKMIGIKDMAFEGAGAFVRTHAQAGSNLRAGIVPGKGPGINVDLGVLDVNFPQMTDVPSWGAASLKDRVDAVIAHEYTEVVARPMRGLDFHQQALKFAPETPLGITSGARQILREYRQAMGLQ